MARPVKFTREIILEMAKRYFELTPGVRIEEWFKNEGIDKSTFHKLLKKYDIKVKITAEVYWYFDWELYDGFKKRKSLPCCSKGGLKWTIKTNFPQEYL